MKVLIVGGGRSGSYIASRLKKDHKVTIVESDAQRVGVLKEQFSDIEIIKGDGCEPHISIVLCNK